VDATQEALLEAAARTARLRRSLPPRRSKHTEPAPARAAEGGSVAVKAPEPANAQATPTTKSAQPEYAKAHLKELIARRKQAANANESQSGRDAGRELREAKSLLHGQHYARAEKLLHGLVELEPQNEVYKTYLLWSRWRAQPDAAESSLPELRDLAKKLVAEAEHAAFAAYVLGHVFLHEKRDDLAEKFFKRAHTADRGNKDAERHLVILERRKQTAADGGGAGNRKLFGIQLPNSKPKP
jgi:tetratricopeptide (TPR) repeat protein